MKKKLRNKFEKKINAQLKRNRCSYSYESVSIPYTLNCKYVPDFIIERPSGTIYIECKGYLRPEDKRKLVAVKRQNPGLDLRIVFYARREDYIKWANKHKFPWTVGSIPKEWRT